MTYIRLLHTINEYFFKVYRQGIRRIEEIQDEIDLLNHLKASDIETTLPVVRCDGKFISEFNTANGNRFGVLFTSVGNHGLSEVEETAELNEQLGGYVASIHRAWDSVNLGGNRWNLDEGLFIDRAMHAIREFSDIHVFDIGFLESIAKDLKSKLAILPVRKSQYGMCHGDIYSGNIRVGNDNSPILFDFDFCGTGWRAYDISMYAFPFGMGCDVTKLKKREERKHQFLNGYNKVRAMSNEEIESIALFVPFRRIFNLGMLYITFLPNTWGDIAVIRNVDEDVALLKKWFELNPIL